MKYLIRYLFKTHILHCCILTLNSCVNMSLAILNIEMFKRYIWSFILTKFNFTTINYIHFGLDNCDFKMSLQSRFYFYSLDSIGAKGLFQKVQSVAKSKDGNDSMF